MHLVTDTAIKHHAVLIRQIEPKIGLAHFPREAEGFIALRCVTQYRLPVADRVTRMTQ